MNAPFGGEMLLADVSAVSRAEDPRVHREVAAALNARQLATCTIATFEVLVTARNAHELEDLEATQAELRWVPVSDSVQRAAIGALRDLARRGAGRHRIPLPDVLIAAAAQEAGIGVLHYDHHFDRLAEVLHFRSVWLAPAGSI